MGIITNPILPGFNPDTTITHVPDVGYLICTSSFEFWPALPIYHSTDLVSWKLVGHALNRRDQGIDLRNLENSAGLWAPTIRYHKGRVYVACTSVNRFQPPFAMGEVYMSRSFYVWTENILDEKAWSSAVFVDEPGIDPDLFFDDDERVYLTTSRRIRHADTTLPLDIGLYVAEIDLQTGSSVSPSVLIRCSDPEKKRSGTVEGSHIHKHDGKYYLFAAEGGTETGHCATISRSDNVFGPYEQPPAGVNPIVHNTGDHPDIQSVGHMDIVNVQGSDVWLAVFLGVRPTRPSGGERPEWSTTGHLGRETFAAGMVWTESGWPQVNHGKSIELKSEYHGIPTSVREVTDWHEKFQGPALSQDWYTIRTPLKPFWKVDPQTGLSISGNVHRLDGYQENPACLLIRQKDRLLEFAAEMTLFVDAEHVGQEAGVTLYMAKSSHASLALRLSRDPQGKPVRQLVFRKPDGSGGDTKKLLEGFDAVNASDAEMRAKIGEFADYRASEETVIELEPEVAVSEQIRFFIRAREFAYEFGYRLSNQDQARIVGELSIEKLNPLFTGAHLGIFAQGDDGRPVLGAAVFRSVEYRVVDN